jgi:ketopantoate reductase
MLENGKKTEIDDLNGKIIEMGNECKIETKINKKIVELVKKAENELKSPNLSGEEVFF